MKMICKLLLGKVNPKILLIITISFFSGSISPEILETILDLLSE